MASIDVKACEPEASIDVETSPTGWQIGNPISTSLTMSSSKYCRLRRSVSTCNRGMFTKGVDGCNDIFSRMIVIDNGINGCMDVSSIFSRIIVVDLNVLGIHGCTCMSTKGVDRFKDISSRMCLRRCLRMYWIVFQDCGDKIIHDSFNIGLRKSCHSWDEEGGRLVCSR